MTLTFKLPDDADEPISTRIALEEANLIKRETLYLLQVEWEGEDIQYSLHRTVDGWREAIRDIALDAHLNAWERELEADKLKTPAYIKLGEDLPEPEPYVEPTGTWEEIVDAYFDDDCDDYWNIQEIEVER